MLPIENSLSFHCGSRWRALAFTPSAVFARAWNVAWSINAPFQGRITRHSHGFACRHKKKKQIQCTSKPFGYDGRALKHLSYKDERYGEHGTGFKPLALSLPSVCPCTSLPLAFPAVKRSSSSLLPPVLVKHTQITWCLETFP